MPARTLRSPRRSASPVGHRAAAEGRSPTTTSSRCSTRPTSGSSSAPASASATSAAPPPGCRSKSGRTALDMSGVDLAEIDALVLATTTPDRTVPARRPRCSNELGLRCGAFDVNAACSGFMYGLVMAHGLIAMGARKVLLHRHRHARRGSPTGPTATPPSCSPTGPAPSCSRPSTDPASCSAGISTPTARPSASCTPRSAGSSRWRARRSSAAPCASWSTRPRSR